MLFFCLVFVTAQEFSGLQVQKITFFEEGKGPERSHLIQIELDLMEDRYFYGKLKCDNEFLSYELTLAFKEEVVNEMFAELLEKGFEKIPSHSYQHAEEGCHTKTVVEYVENGEYRVVSKYGIFYDHHIFETEDDLCLVEELNNLTVIKSYFDVKSEVSSMYIT